MRPDALLEVTDVHMAFGPVRAVRGVSLAVWRGESVSIIGPNGAGKSTLFGVVAGEHRPTAGRVAFRGRDVTAWPASRLARSRLSRTFQVARFFGSRTVRDNLVMASVAAAGHGSALRPWDLFGARGRHVARAERVLEQLSLASHAHVPAQVLAQGDRKRLEFAMALAQEPELLLLDEPTAGMSLEDTVATIRLLAEIRREHSDMAIVLTAHDMDVVFALSDRVLLMGQGEVVLEGTPDEVEQAPETRELYLGSA